MVQSRKSGVARRLTFHLFGEFLAEKIRKIISDLTADGGFPPLMMQQIDFADLFRKKFAKQMEGQPAGNA